MAPRVPEILPGEQLNGSPSQPFAAGDVVPRQDFTARQNIAMGQAAIHTGGVLTETGLRLKDMISETAATRADAQLSDAYRGISQDFFSKVGQDAVDAHKDAVDALGKTQQQISESLGDDAFARQMFERSANQRRNSESVSFDHHAIEQAHVASVGASKGRIKASIDDAVTYGLQRGTVGTSQYFDTALAETDKLAKTLGITDPDTLRVMRLQTSSDIHAGIVRGLLDSGQASKAKEYLDGLSSQEPGKQQITPQELAQLQGQVKHQSDNDIASKAALSVMDVVDETSMKALAKSEGRAVDRSELRPMEQLAIYTDTLDKAYRSGQLTESQWHAALDVVEHRAVANAKIRGDAIQELTQKAQQWANDNPFMPASQVPSDIYQGMQKYGELGSLARIERTANTQKAAALHGLVTDTDQKIKAEQQALDQDREIPALERRIRNGEAGKSDVEDLAANRAKLAEKNKYLNELRRNRADFANARDTILKYQAGQPVGEGQPTPNPVDVLLQEIRAMPAPRAAAPMLWPSLAPGATGPATLSPDAEREKLRKQLQDAGALPK